MDLVIIIYDYNMEEKKYEFHWACNIQEDLRQLMKPEFQGKVIARKLIGQAFSYGRMHGAKKDFLMADECNVNAIHL